MSPRRESHRASESNFPDITQLGEAMTHAFQNAIRSPPPPQRTPLETMYNLKLDRFMGNEGHEGAEKWLDHIEKTFQVMQSQGNLPANRWVETTTWFLGRKPAAWWLKQTKFMSPEMAADWEVFKENFMKRFVPSQYIDRKKQEFTQLKQKNMSAHEYYRKFTDLSRYDPDTASNQAKMLRRFKLGTKRKWQTFSSALPCTDYHEFSEILVWMEDSDNLPSNSEDDEDKNDNQKKDDRGKDIMESVGEVVVVVLATFVDRWDIGLLSVPKVSRDLSNLLCHLQRRFNRALDQAVIVRRVVVVITTTRVILLPMLPDSISIPRILILRLGIPKTLEVILLILPCQLVDLSGIREVSPDRERLLLAVQDHLSSLASQDRDVLLRGEVTKF
ncbi:hypothetical protein ACFXTN_006378 [Malus domestica]